MLKPKQPSTMVLILLMVLLLSGLTYGQVKVTGLVKDDSGAPLIGASVVEKGTNSGTKL